ncbi:Protein transport protein bos1, variant 2 [Batrachochytrium dendrobatidis]|nr:Protein transport protein bos1, variant 2 [Batrachochytrium dendrobatidis]OAJ38847.1 hypothetical protein BDEG_22746 [Batrachochytrium dendrobatidis JEL423]
MLSRREVTSVKREITSGRASTLRDEHCQIQSAFDRYCSIESARIASEQRQELLGLDNSLQQRNSGANHFNHPEEQSTILMMDGLINERNVLEGAEQSIEQYLTMGRNALHELYEQRSMLKSTQKRLLDVANSLGLSSSVIRFIEQRTAADQWILYGGLAGTCLILWAIVHYFG